MTQLIEKDLFREGILKPGPFTENYELRCYEPSVEMSPFVEHYFISRRRPGYDPEYTGSDVLSQPVVTLFLKPEGAYFEGPTTGTRYLAARNSPIYAGAQFKPGGFYPFWQKRVSSLAEKAIPAPTLLPTVTPAYARSLLRQTNNQVILSAIDKLLRNKHPQADPNIRLLNEIIAAIESAGGTITVSELAARFGWSERTLQHMFHTYIGVGMKWAIKRARFLEIIKVVRTQPNPNWTVIAAEFGYTDQSHFINEFKKLVGQSPAQYMRKTSG